MVDTTQESPRRMSRRSFLKLSGATAGLAALEVFGGITGCTIRPPESGNGVYEVGVNPDNFQTVLMKLKEVSDEIPIRLSLSAGEYQLPQWQEMPVPTNKNWESTRESARVNFSISNKKRIELVGNSQNPESTVININGEVGLHFSNCESVGFQGITFRGGLPRTKGERGDATTSAIRSQILIENASSVTSNFCRHEGMAVPIGHVPDFDELGISGIAVFNSAVEVAKLKSAKRTNVSVSDNTFQNVPWDGVSCVGAVDGDVSRTRFLRNSGSLDPNVEGGRAACWNRGSACASLNGAYLKFTDSTVSGYRQPIFLNDVGGAKIESINITAPEGIAPTAWTGKYLIGVQWPVTPSGEWVIHQPGRPVGNLTINGLYMFPENFDGRDIDSLPQYLEWFTGLVVFNHVNMDELRLAALAEGVHDQEYLNFLSEAISFGTRFSITNWTIVTPSKFSVKDYPKGGYISMDEPKIIEVRIND